MLVLAAFQSTLTAISESLGKDRCNLSKRQRAEIIQQRLAELYPDPAIPLDHRDPYTLLVAVLLSAQCTDKMVNLVTPKLWALADNPHDMCLRQEAEILEVIRRR